MLILTDIKQYVIFNFRYPNYEILHNAMDSLGKYTERYSVEGVFQIVAELTILQNCDYFVGTFSSNVRF